MTADACGSRKSCVSETVITPPGTRVWPFMTKRVAASAVKVSPLSVRISGGAYSKLEFSGSDGH
jgi:hypothetical protein